MKHSNINKEYNRVRRNLSRRIKSLEKRGYMVEKEVPARPKKITEGSVRRIKSFSEKIEDVTVWVDEDGVIHSYGYGRNVERARAAEKAAETRKKNGVPFIDIDDVIIEEFEAFIRRAMDIANSYLQAPGERGKAYFSGILFRAEVVDDNLTSITINEEERKKVAHNLRDKKEECLRLLEQYIYESDGRGPNGQENLLFRFLEIAGETGLNRYQIINDIYESQIELY